MAVLPAPTFFTWVLLLLLVFIGFLLTFCVVLPFRKVRSYKQEGVSTYFFPLLGLVRLFQESKTKYKDVIGKLKEPKPNTKYTVTHILATPVLILQDSQYIKDFLQKQNSYTKIIEIMKLLAGNGLVAAEGETWKRHRRIVSASFNFELLKMNIPVIQDTTREFFDKITSEDYKGYSVINKIQNLTGEIVGRIFFGENLNSYTIEGKSLTTVLAEVTAELAEASLTTPAVIFGPKVIAYGLLPKYKRVINRVKNFRGLCFKIVQDRRSKGEPQGKAQDLLSCLLATQQSPDPESRFSDEEIVDEFITFFIAGMDTTGHLIGMTLYNLTQYPEYLSQLEIERKQTYDKEGELTPDTLTKMEILHCLMKETLRFYTPAPLVFLRKATHDHNILDLKVKKGELVTPAFLTPAFDEKHFENPKQFDPLRWKSLEGKLDPYAFAPFSAGPRNCIGQHLAIMEAKVIISEFLKRFEFSLKEGYDLKMIIRFCYEPEDEVLLKLVPRN